MKIPNIKQKTIYELSLLFDNKRITKLICLITCVVGSLTAFSCSGARIIWRICVLPKYVLPLMLFNILWILNCFMFGIVIAIAFSCRGSKSIFLRSLISYFTALFWYPLLLGSTAAFCAAASIFISAAYLISVSRVFFRYSLIGAAASGMIILFFIYVLYFTLSFATLN